MKKMLLTLTAIAVVALFLLTPISALSPLSTVKKNTMISEISSVIRIQPPVIPQSEFVITLDDNEEIIWTADSVTRDDDIAYVTMETTCEAGELEREPQTLPKLGWNIWRHISYKITARNWWGWPLFYTRANAWAKFNTWNGRCADIIDLSTSFSFCVRYTRAGFDSYTGGLGQDYAEVTADGRFRDNIIHQYPRIHVWASYDWYSNEYTTDGYLDWEY